MPPSEHEIYLAAIRLGNSEDLRPWVVVEGPVANPDNPDELLVVVVPCSTAFDLFDDCHDFMIRSTDPDFVTTGLRRDSFIICEYPVRVPVSRLERRLGRLSGQMLEDFKAWVDG